MKVYENIALSDYHNYIKYLDIDYNLYEIHVNVNVCTDIETDWKIYANFTTVQKKVQFVAYNLLLHSW